MTLIILIVAPSFAVQAPVRGGVLQAGCGVRLMAADIVMVEFWQLIGIPKTLTAILLQPPPFAVFGTYNKLYVLVFIEG